MPKSSYTGQTIPRNFFPTIKMNNYEKETICQQFTEKLESLLLCLDQENKNGFNWIPCESKDGIHLSKAHYIEQQGSQEGAACVLYRGTAFISGTIEDVLESIASNDTEEYRRIMHSLYEGIFVDCMCLDTLNTIHPEKPYVFTALKWLALRSMSPGVEGHDYSFIEYSGLDRDQNGKATGFIIQDSIDRREIPSLEAIYRLKRGYFHRTGILIQESNRSGNVQITCICQSDASNRESLQLAEIDLKTRIGGIKRISPLIERKRLGHLQFMDQWRWARKEKKKECFVCKKSFTLRKKHNCRCCGQVVCGKCGPERDVELAVLGTTKMRICTSCVVSARREHVESTKMRDVSIVSSLSSASSTNNNFITTKEYEEVADQIIHPNQHKVVPSLFNEDLEAEKSKKNNTYLIEEEPQRQEEKESQMYLYLHERLALIKERLDDAEIISKQDPNTKKFMDKVTSESASIPHTLRDQRMVLEEALAHQDAIENSFIQNSQSIDKEVVTVVESELPRKNDVCQEDKEEEDHYVDFSSLSGNIQPCSPSLSDTEKNETDINEKEMMNELALEVMRLRERAEKAEMELEKQREHSSNTAANSPSPMFSQYSLKNDPVFKERKKTYNALVKELHEIMGLPGLRDSLRLSGHSSGTISNDSILDALIARLSEASVDDIEKEENQVVVQEKNEESLAELKEDFLLEGKSTQYFEPIYQTNYEETAKKFLFHGGNSTEQVDLEWKQWKDLLDEMAPWGNENQEMIKKAYGTLCKILHSLMKMQNESPFRSIKLSTFEYAQALKSVPRIESILKCIGYKKYPQRFELECIRVEWMERIYSDLLPLASFEESF